MAGMLRRAGLMAAVTASAFALGGCVKVNGGGALQEGVVGPVKIEVDLCSSSSLPPTTCGSWGIGPGETPSLLIAQLVPDWAAPAATAALSGALGDHTLTRSADYEARLQQGDPAPAGRKWVGYRSPGLGAVAVATHYASVTFTYDVADAPTSTFPYLTTVSYTAPTTGTLCVPTGAPPGGTPCRLDSSGTLNLSLNRLSLAAPPSPLVLRPGEHGVMTFIANGESPSGAPPLPVSATGGPPGTTLSAPGQLILGTTPELPVDFRVPAGTPPGDYPLTVTAGSAGGTRSATGIVRVPAPAAPPTTPTPTPAPTPPGPPSTTPAPSRGTARPISFDAGIATLAGALNAPGSKARLRAGRLVFRFNAPARGTLRISLLRKVRGRNVVVASALRSIPRAALTSVKLSPTRRGRRILAASGPIRLKLQGRFTPRGAGKRRVVARNVTVR